MGEDRALVRLGAAPPRLRDRVGAAGAALDAAHIGALQALEDFFRKQKRWSELVGALARHAECRERASGAGRDPVAARRHATRRQLGDATQAMAAYQRALDTDEHCIDAINALERLYRRTQAWDRLIDVLSKKSQVVEDTEEVIRLQPRSASCGRIGWATTTAPSTPTRRSCRSIRRTCAALKALERLYEKTGRIEKHLDVLEQQLDVAPPDEERVALYERMAAAWEEHFAQARPRAEVLEKILLIDERNAKAYRELERLYRQERKWESLVETYRKHIAVDDRRDQRIDLYAKMGQVYEEELKDLDRAIEAYNDVLRSTPTTPTRWRPWSPVREDRGVGPRHRHDAAPDPRQHRRRSSRSSCTSGSARSTTSS